MLDLQVESIEPADELERGQCSTDERTGASNFQRPGFFSRASRTAIQTVGTPQAMVTRRRHKAKTLSG